MCIILLYYCKSHLTEMTSSLVIFIEGKSQFRRACELYTVRLTLRVLRASLSSDDDFGEHSVGRVRAWHAVAVS